MVVRYCIFISLAVVAFSTLVLSQGTYDSYAGKTFWLRHSLVLEGDTRVFSNDIRFESTDGKILNRGAQVIVRSIVDEANFSRVRFTSGGGDYHLFVHRAASGIDRRAFNLVFSSEPIKEYWAAYLCEGKMRSKADVITCLGFPLSTERRVQNGTLVEKLYYTCWYVGKCDGFDTFWIEIKKGRITEITGTV